MTKRIEAITSYIEKNEKVIDVGCDGALLSILLAKKNIYSIASDLRENIIKNAEINIDPKLKKYISFRIGNGITLVEHENDYIPVLAGMGTHLILEILANTNKKFKKIITISNNNHDILRTQMLNLGYISSIEEIIKEKNIYYNLIVFVPGNKKYTEEEILIGLNHQNINLLKEKNKYLITKYRKILENINNKEKCKEIEKKINILYNYKGEDS